MARVPPISPLKTGRTGTYLALRSSPADGACGVHAYPCRHPGYDAHGTKGTPVVAPESGVVAALASGASPPYQGYGPWVVIIKGGSGRYHLLAHLDPATNRVQVGQQVSAGQQVGTTSSANHTHWEVRRRITPAAGQTNLQNNEDPQTWLTGARVATLLLAALAGWGAYRWWRAR